MNGWRKQLGREGEEAAVKFLQQRKYQILKRNQRYKFGEVDILAEAPVGDIVIIEVKTKTGNEQGNPLEEIDERKQRKLLVLAREVLADYPERYIRIDAIGVDMTSSGQPKIEHIINAVEARH